METRSLPCVLTEPELLERGNRVADVLRDLEDLDEKRKQAAADFKGRIDVLDATARQLGKEIRTKTEYRMVEVVRETDYRRNVAEVVRSDTGEVIESRPLTPAERQMEIQPAKALKLEPPTESTDA